MTDLSRRYLLTLLLRSYLDASPGLHKASDDVGYVSRGKKSGAGKAPLHVGESRDLWQQGSYRELDHALHKLAAADMSAYHAVFLLWIHRRPAGRSLKEHVRYVMRFRDAAERGQSFLLNEMPWSIRVPVTIQENAGHVRRPA